MTDVAIRIDGVDYADDTDIHVAYGLDQFSRSFSIGFGNRWLLSNLHTFPFEEGAACEILLDGEKVIDGFIDEIPIDRSGTDHRLSVTGRSWTGHMVDSSAIHETGAWKNATLLVIAEAIAEPFGCGVVVHDPQLLPEVNTPFRRFAIEDEELAYDCIMRAAKMRGVFLTSDAERNIVVTRGTKTVRTNTVLTPYNTFRARREGRFSERFSEYIVKSQNAGDDTWYAENATSKLFHRARDPQVTSYRPLIIVSEGQGSKPELELRADWERNVRAGRSRKLFYEWNGVRDDAGRLWQPNTLVAVDDPGFNVSGDLLIASVSIKRSEGGTSTSLELVSPDAYDVLTPPKPKTKKKGGWHK